jgi:threonine dehydratase
MPARIADNLLALVDWPGTPDDPAARLDSFGPERRLPSVVEIEQAARTMSDWAVPTPVLGVEWMGAPISLKDETRQPTSSFKVRGAFTAMAAAKEAGVSEVIACSAGNHGAGLVWAAQRLCMSATIYIPENCPPVKRAKMEKGARVVVCAGGYDDAERAARQAADETALPFISPFDDAAVMAGNGGTLARELETQKPGPLTILVPVGGGGLIGGMMVWATARSLPWRFVGVQSEASPAFVASLRDGTFYGTWDSDPTVAEGLEGGAGLTSVRLARRLGVSTVVVREEDVVSAMRRARLEFGITMEGSSAVVLAACPAVRAAGMSGEIVGIITGGNVQADAGAPAFPAM